MQREKNIRIQHEKERQKTTRAPVQHFLLTQLKIEKCPTRNQHCFGSKNLLQKCCSFGRVGITITIQTVLFFHVGEGLNFNPAECGKVTKDGALIIKQ